MAAAEYTVEHLEQTGLIACVACDHESLCSGPDSTCEQKGLCSRAFSHRQIIFLSCGILIDEEL